MPGKYCADCSCDSKEQACDFCRLGGMRCTGTCACCQRYRDNRAGTTEKASVNVDASLLEGRSGTPSLSEQGSFSVQPSRSLPEASVQPPSAVPGSANININLPSTCSSGGPPSTIRFDITEHIPPSYRAAIAVPCTSATEYSAPEDMQQTGSQTEGSAGNLPSTSSSHPTGTPGTSASCGDIIRRIPTYAEIRGVQEERLFWDRIDFVKEIRRYVYFFEDELHLVMCGIYFRTNVCSVCSCVIDWSIHWRHYDPHICSCPVQGRVNENSLYTLPPNSDISTFGSRLVTEIRNPIIIFNNWNIRWEPAPIDGHERIEPIEYILNVRCQECTNNDWPTIPYERTMEFTCCICGRVALIPLITRHYGPEEAGTPPLSSAAGSSTSDDADRRQYTASESVRENLPSTSRVQPDAPPVSSSPRQHKCHGVGACNCFADEENEPQNLPPNSSSRDPPSDSRVIDVTEYFDETYRATITVSAAEYASLPVALRTSSQPEGSAENLPSTSASQPTGTPGTVQYSGPIIRRIPTMEEIFNIPRERLFREENGRLRELSRYRYHFVHNELLFVSCGLFVESNCCRNCLGMTNCITGAQILLYEMCHCRVPRLISRDSLRIFPANIDISNYRPRIDVVRRPRLLNIHDGKIEVVNPIHESEAAEYDPIDLTPNIRCHRCTRLRQTHLSSGEMTIFNCCVCGRVARVPLIRESPITEPTGEPTVSSALDPSTSAEADRREQCMASEAIVQTPGPAGAPPLSNPSTSADADRREQYMASEALGQSSQSSAPEPGPIAGFHERRVLGRYTVKVFQGPKSIYLNVPTNFPLIGPPSAFPANEVQMGILGNSRITLSEVSSRLQLTFTLPCPTGVQERLIQPVSDIQNPPSSTANSPDTSEDKYCLACECINYDVKCGPCEKKKCKGICCCCCVIEQDPGECTSQSPAKRARTCTQVDSETESSVTGDEDDSSHERRILGSCTAKVIQGRVGGMLLRLPTNFPFIGPPSRFTGIPLSVNLLGHSPLTLSAVPRGLQVTFTLPYPSGLQERLFHPVSDIQIPAKRARTCIQRDSATESSENAAESSENAAESPETVIEMSADDSHTESVELPTPSKPQRQRKCPFESPAKYQKMTVPSTRAAPSISGVQTIRVPSDYAQRNPLGGLSHPMPPYVRPASIIRNVVPVRPNNPNVSNVRHFFKEGPSRLLFTVKSRNKAQASTTGAEISGPAERAATSTQEDPTSARTRGMLAGKESDMEKDVATPSKSRRKRVSPFESPAKYRRLTGPSTSAAPSTSRVATTPFAPDSSEQHRLEIAVLDGIKAMKQYFAQGSKTDAEITTGTSTSAAPSTSGVAPDFSEHHRLQKIVMNWIKAMAPYLPQASATDAEITNVPSTSAVGASSPDASGRYCELCDCTSSDDFCDICKIGLPCSKCKSKK